MKIKIVILFPLCLLFWGTIQAQSPAARYEIDAKRNGVAPTDKDALPRGREFIRLDSTYYVGWYYTGMFKYDRAADYAGFHNAVPDLLKAFKLLDKDFKSVLSNLFSTPIFYIQNNVKFNDYLVLARTLRDTYENLEMPDSSMWVLDQVDRKNFRRDFLGVNQMKAWTIHRNRFYTSKEFKWLKNSVRENEQLALNYCYQALGTIKRNKAANDVWFGPTHDQTDNQFVYHYLALLQCYNQQYDSAEYYYDKMKYAGFISWNNYGNMQSEIGEFKKSEENYSKDKYKYGDQKFLREPFYYIPTLRIYAGDPKDAMKIATEAIVESNSTPGFGWYNLALARAYLYDGQLDSADLTIDKAKEFKEIHIGTTLTQLQYDFTVGTLRLVWYNMKISQLKFLHADWWYSPSILYELANLTVSKYMHQYVMATKLAANPERERIVYELFCGEGTTTFDESWYLLKDFSTGFFIKKMENYLQNDPRKNIKRYFSLFKTQLEWKDGDEKKAKEDYEKLLNTTLLDTAYEKLFLARMYEGLAKSYDYTKDKSKRDFYTNLLFEHFPQLVPYSGLPVKVKLTVLGDDDADAKAVIKELKNCSIDFIDNADENSLSAVITIEKKGIKHLVSVASRSASNNKISNQNTNKFYFMKPEGAGREIAKRIFGSSGALEIEPPPVPEKKK
ncbi:MAG: hypothetical protein ABIX01_13450 [Chitinophagaceae bacterium]